MQSMHTYRAWTNKEGHALGRTQQCFTMRQFYICNVNDQGTVIEFNQHFSRGFLPVFQPKRTLKQLTSLELIPGVLNVQDTPMQRVVGRQYLSRHPPYPYYQLQVLSCSPLSVLSRKPIH